MKEGNTWKGFVNFGLIVKIVQLCKIWRMFVALGFIQCMKSQDLTLVVEKFLFDECDGNENFSLGVWWFFIYFYNFCYMGNIIDWAVSMRKTIRTCLCKCNNGNNKNLLVVIVN
jgi:hypothetical protein